MSKLIEQKQAQLNALQLSHDKLLTRIQDLESENKFLRALSAKGEDDTRLNNEDAETFSGTTIEYNDPYPRGTVLFGGHPNWQRKFSAIHPEVKVFSGTEDFSENIVSPNTPLVLVNSHHMSHKVFYKIRRLRQRQGWEIKYVK